MNRELAWRNTVKGRAVRLLLAACLVFGLVAWAGGRAGAQTLWTLRPTSIAANLNGVTWGNNLFVAVGAGGTVLTSPDGVAWIKRAQVTPTPLSDLAWSGTRFVAVGIGAGAMITSTDGVNWSQVAGLSSVQLFLKAIAWSGSRFVAVGLNGTTMTSTDGLTWTARVLPTPHDLMDVTWTGSAFVAVGASGKIWGSVDGNAWSERSSGTTATLLTVASSGSRMVACGGAGTTLSSTAGTSWAYHYANTILDLTASTWMGTQFVAVGWNSLGWGVYASADGGTWTQTFVAGPRQVSGIAWSGTRLVVVGHGGFVMTCTPRYAYVRSAAEVPWGIPASDPGSNERAMDRAFGEDNWDDLRYEQTTAAQVFAPGRDVVFMEGGDMNQDELEAFLILTATPLQQWVAKGGRLVINAAPSQGDGMACGFGVTLNYSPPATVLGSVESPMPGHPVFHYPAEAGSAFTGADFSRATVSGSGVTALLTGTGANVEKVVLGEIEHGVGRVLIGGMTPAKYHQPQPGGNNLRSNILTYASPPVVTAPEIGVEQPAGTAIPDGGGKNFGAVVTGKTSSLTFTIKNTGRADLTGISVTKEGPHAADFTVTANPAATVSGPTGRTLFTVRFAPAVAGVRTASLKIASNDADENPYDIVLTGEGVPAIPAIRVEQPKGMPLVAGATVDYGAVQPKKKPKMTFRVVNSGTGPLEGISVNLSGPSAAEFKLNAKFTAPLQPGKAKNFTVQMVPLAPGYKQATLRIASNDPDAAENPFVIQLVGTSFAAAAPAVAVRSAGEKAGVGAHAPDATADADGDGTADLLEWATGGDPERVSRPPLRIERAGDFLEMYFPRATAAVEAGAILVPEWSKDLHEWSAEGIEETVLSVAGGIEQVRARARVDGDRKFLRLRVTAPR